MGLRAYTVNIYGLSNKVHEYDFEIGDDFFAHYGTGLVETGEFKVHVTLDKHETFIDASFEIKGVARLTCDRSLDPFDFPIKTRKKLMFKFGDNDEELSDEIVLIRRDTDSLELGQYVYEFIGLQVPMKKLHPRYANEAAEDEPEGKVVYTSGDAPKDDGNDDDIDPRWEKLKNLK